MLRFAPSPTGDMHIGNLRVALFNHIMAKKLNMPLLIRIEDTDKERNIQGKDKEILELLSIFGIEYFSVIYQSHNLRLHQQKANELLEKGLAFRCYCTQEELEAKKEEAIKRGIAYRYDGKCENIKERLDKPFTIRIKKPNKPIGFVDKIKGSFEFSPDEIDSFVIIRNDGTPVYNFACAIDDMEWKIKLIIRGEDHLSNTPKQIHIQHSLGIDYKIEYAHLPIILNQDGKKMSKRDDASSIKWLLEQGIVPKALANYLILLGNKCSDEIFELQDAYTFFELENISKSPAKFDMAKLYFINREHLRKIDKKEVADAIGMEFEKIKKLLEIYLKESQTLIELKSKLKPIFEPKIAPKGFEEQFLKLKEILLKMDFPNSYEDFKKELIQKSGLKGKELFKPLRVLLTGKEDGPELAELYDALRERLKEIVTL